WGGILFGCLAGAVVVKRSGNSVFQFMDAVAPGLLLAQGIGRSGNWAEQEQLGNPTAPPWGQGPRPDPHLVSPVPRRQADAAALGAGDRPGAPPGRSPGGHDLPSDVPVRADL